MADQCACSGADRNFGDLLATTASLQHLEQSGPTYVASLIAMFYAHASGHTSVVSTIHPGSEDFETSYAAAAVVPLTELVAARGLIDTVPVLDWLLAGGAQLKVKYIVAIARTRYLVVRALCLRPDASITPIFG